jgi:signal transduction histidine kinase
MKTAGNGTEGTSGGPWHEITLPQRDQPCARTPYRPERLLSLLRYFTVIGIVAFSIVTVALSTFYRRTALRNLLHVAQEQNVVLTQAFSNSLWPGFASFLSTVAELGAEELRQRPEVVRLREAVVALMRDTSVVRVKIYDLQGRTVFSTEASQIGVDQSANPGVVAGKAGKITSELTHRNTFNAFDGEIENRNVLASYVPIRRAQGGPIEGVFELYDDVTPLVETMERTQRGVMLGVTGILVVLYGALFLAVRYADGVVRHQRRERDEAEQARERLEGQLRHRQRMEAIGTLAGGVAHDFNNLLSVILACSEMSTEELPPDSPAREKLEEIKVAARRGSDLVQQVLTFSRQEKQERRPLSMRAVVDEALRLLRLTLPSTVEIRCQMEETGRVLASASQMHQMVVNLVTNAVHALGGDGGRLEVTLTTAQVGADEASSHPDLRPGRYIKLTVSDSGCGMDAATMGRIFDPFFSTKDVGEGVGMGLAIVHGVVAGVDGAIQVRSAPGQGTMFQVFLPEHDGECRLDADEEVGALPERAQGRSGLRDGSLG